jgi:D-amino-acid dehydrogenase
MDTDVLIVGGGALGVATAYALARSKVDVTVLDASQIASKCSFGNAGIIAISKFLPMASRASLKEGILSLARHESSVVVKLRRDREFLTWLRHFVTNSIHDRPSSRAALYRLNLFSGAVHREFAVDIAQDYGYEEKGWLHIYREQGLWDRDLQQAKTTSRELGVRFEALDSARVRALQPAIKDAVVGGIHYLDDRHLRPDVFVHCMAERARDLGARIFEQVPVDGFRVSGRRVTAVETAAGEVSCKWLVVAAGVWSKVLARRLGVVLPIEPGRGHSVTFKPEKDIGIPLKLRERNVTLSPMGGSVRASAGFDLVGLDASIGERKVEKLVGVADDYLDGLGASQDNSWVGFRPMTPDDLPIIGRIAAWENVLACVGHGTLGITLSPGSARLIRNEIIGVAQPFDTRPFRADRFGL